MPASMRNTLFRMLPFFKRLSDRRFRRKIERRMRTSTHDTSLPRPAGYMGGRRGGEPPSGAGVPARRPR